jgi:SEL1 protein
MMLTFRSQDGSSCCPPLPPQAAGQGHADANFYLGIMHHKGLGVRRKNVQKAFQYYSMASQGGHVHAMYNAAMMQLAGKGTVK